jgi:tRNA pseudouridine38-40 synthase
MRRAAAHLIGRHDFTTFRSSECQADSPVRTMDGITLEEVALPDGAEIRASLRARSFLHNQVRSIMGSLERVGAGAWTDLDMKSALDARDRTRCGPVAPPQGLVLTGVSYDPSIF